MNDPLRCPRPPPAPTVTALEFGFGFDVATGAASRLRGALLQPARQWTRGPESARR